LVAKSPPIPKRYGVSEKQREPELGKETLRAQLIDILTADRVTGSRPGKRLTRDP
jgi:hypothetical protein